MEVVGGEHDGERRRRPQPISEHTATTREVQTTRSAGDPRFLRVGIGAVKQISELLGLNEPQQVAWQGTLQTEATIDFASEPAWLADWFVVADRFRVHMEEVEAAHADGDADLLALCDPADEPPPMRPHRLAWVREAPPRGQLFDRFAHGPPSAPGGITLDE